MIRHSLRENLKKMPLAVPTVRAARSVWRRLRTKYLLIRYPKGGFLTCNGVKVFCNFRNDTYAWYDGPSANLRFDQLVIKAMADQSEGNVFIDLGAHFGFFAAYMADLTRDARVIALEPDREHFRCLKRTTSALPDRRVVLLQQAISDRDGTVSLYETEASCLHTYPEEGSRLVYERPCISLDSLIAAHCGNSDKVALIKIDVDGAEPLFLAGGKDTIEKHRPLILTEFAPFHLKRFGVNPRQFYRQLCDRFHVYWVAHCPSQRIARVGPADFEQIEATTGCGVTDLVLSMSALAFPDIEDGG